MIGSWLRLKFRLVLLYLVAYFVLLYGYKYFVVPVFSYSGYSWDFSFIKCCEGIVMLVIVSIFMPCHFDKPSDVLIHIQFLFPVLPMIVLYSAQNRDRWFFYAALLAFLFILMFVALVKFRAVKVKAIFSVRVFCLILLWLGWCVVTVIILLGGLKFFNLNIWKVYEYRSLAAANLPKGFGYISHITSKVIFPLSLLIALVRRNGFLMLLSFLGSVMMFALTAHKGPLFYPVVVLLLYYISHRDAVIEWILWGYISIVFLSVLWYILFGDITIGTLMLRRNFFAPAHLCYLYHDFFSVNPHALWAHSKVTLGLIHFDYPLDIPHLIGAYYYNRPECGANTGWIGSGYANAGYAGMFLCALIIGFLLVVIDSYGRTVDKNMVVSVVVVPLLTVFASSDIFTAMLTHGTLFTLLCLLIFPKCSDLKHDRGAECKE